MKKIIMVLLILLVLTGCTKKEEITMIVPFGGPEIAQLYLEASEYYQVDIIQGPDPLIAAFGSNTYDVIFAGSNLGAIMYNSQPEYILLASIVWGSTFLVSTSDIPDMASLEGKEIIAFGRNSTPDIILKYLLAEFDVNATITYVDSVASASAIFVADPTKIVLTSEPVLTNLKSAVSNVNILDFQVLYGQVSVSASYPQASVFIKADLSESKINQLVDDLKDSIDKVNNDREQTANLAVELNIGLSYDVVYNSIPNNNLLYVSAQDAKAALIEYFNLLAETNLQLIGGMLPDDNFYYGE
ncbi:MAG: lipoprotein [Acholeplasmataceae bacterium]|nr:lipoprotein [Acholeplasmataceae bacterium]